MSGLNDSGDAQKDIMGTIKGSVLKLLNQLNDKEKTTLRDIIDKVVASTGVQVSIVNGLVPLIVHQWAEEGNGSINSGRNGGVFKGGKPIRIDPRPRCQTCNQVLRKLK